MEKSVYLSGPITGIEDQNRLAFDDAAYEWKDKGYIVFNPLDNDQGNNPTWESCMRKDLLQLLSADCIAMLPGWEKSKGANLEYHIAKSLGMDAFYAWTFELIPNQETPEIKNILDQAKDLVHGQRQSDYDHPLDNFSRIASIWSVIFKRNVTPEEVGLAMIGLKVARLVHTPNHKDSLIDIPGYAECISMIQEERLRREPKAI